MFGKDNAKCPNCGQPNAIPRIWMGMNPPICPKCGEPAWKKEKQMVYY